MFDLRLTRILTVLTLVALLAAGLPLLPASSASGTTITVCSSGCDHMTVQAALSAAGPGDRVLVALGTHLDALVIPAAAEGLLLCRANVAMNDCATQGPRPQIDARGLGAPALTILAADVTVQGLGFTSDANRGVFIKADGATLSDLEVAVAGTGIVVGIDGDDARSGITVRGSTLSFVPTYGLVGEDAIRGRFHDSRFEDNTMSGFASGVRLRPYGADNEVTGNRFSFLNTGVVVWSENTRIVGNSFEAVQMGIDIAQGGTTRVDGTVLRDNDLGGTRTALRIRAETLEVDARLNDWGVAHWSLIAARIDDNGTDNTVQTLPYLRSGQPEPGLPQAIPASHSTTPSVCDAHPDAEFAAGRCRFLTVQAAIDLAHPGSTVYVPASGTPDPTPYFETLRIDSNDLVEQLDGLTVCGSLGGAICATEIDPAHWQTQQQSRNSTTWANPPAPHSGQALRIDLAEEPHHGSTSWFPADALQIQDLHRFAWDQYLESGSCGAGSPRITIGIDTTGDGMRDSNIQLTSSGLTASCAIGSWQHVELLELGDLRWNSASVGGPSTGTQADAQNAAEAAANANGVHHNVTAVNLVYDVGPGILWFDNHIVNRGFLGEPVDESCVATRSVACRADLAVAQTILDGSGGSDLVSIHADDVRIQGLTIRHTGPPADAVVGIRLDHADGPHLTQNRVLLEGGGCSPDLISSGRCYGPYRVHGIDGTSLDAVIDRNEIRADLIGTSGSIGGTDGIRGEHPGATITNNTLGAWAGNGMILDGQDLLVTGNGFGTTSTGLLLLGNAHDAQVLKNEFLGSEQAIAISSGTPVGVTANDNQIGLGNLYGLQVRDSAGPVVADFTCNDWGVYNGIAIRDTRILAENDPLVNDIQTDPFTAPDAISGTRCLTAPVADFTASQTTVTRGTEITFSDTSSTGDKPIVARHWDFGDGAIGVTPEAQHGYAAPGTYTVTLRIWDLDGMTASATRTITVENLAPLLTVTGSTTRAETETFGLGLEADDPDGDDPITFSASGLPAGATFSDDGDGSATLTWTPPLGSAGSYPVTVTATDALGATSSEPLVLSVTPSTETFRILPLVDLTLIEAGNAQATSIQVVGATGSVTLSASGLPTWATFSDNGDGTGQIAWDPPEGASGTYTVMVTASDDLDTVSLSIDVTVLRYTRIDLQALRGTVWQAAPDAPFEVQVAVRHLEGVDVDVALFPRGPQGWGLSAPETIPLPAGETRIWNLTIVPQEGRYDNRVILQANVLGARGTQETLDLFIRLPVFLEVTFDEAPSVAGGVQGTVEATFLDGSPVTNRTVILGQTVAAPLLGDTSSQVQGTTDANGEFRFDFGIGRTARLPGTHDYEATLRYSQWDWVQKGTYQVQVV